MMIFAATVERATEILSLLLPDQAALVSANTLTVERDRFIGAFRVHRLRYLVNVSVLTTSFGAPHIDAIAILCPTESVNLYQQIVDRSLRLYSDNRAPDSGLCWEWTRLYSLEVG